MIHMVVRHRISPLNRFFPKIDSFLDDYIVVGYGSKERARARARELNGLRSKLYRYSVRTAKEL